MEILHAGAFLESPGELLVSPGPVRVIFEGSPASDSLTMSSFYIFPPSIHSTQLVVAQNNLRKKPYYFIDLTVLAFEPLHRPKRPATGSIRARIKTLHPAMAIGPSSET